MEGHLEATTRQSARWQKSGGVVAALSWRECRTAEVSRPSCWARDLGGPLLHWASVATGMPSDTALSGPASGRPAGAPTPICCRAPHHLQPCGVLSFCTVRFSGLPALRLGGASSSHLSQCRSRPPSPHQRLYMRFHRRILTAVQMLANPRQSTAVLARFGFGLEPRWRDALVGSCLYCVTSHHLQERHWLPVVICQERCYVRCN